MYKLVRNRLEKWPVLAAALFMIIQVFCNLNLPTLTSDMINKGVSTGNTTYIWHTGAKMLGIALIGILASAGNVFFASTQAQKLGTKLRNALFEKVLNFGNHEVDKFGASSLTTRTTNDVLQIQNVTVMILRMMLQAPAMLIGGIIMAYLSEKKLTIVFLVSLPLLAIAIGIVMSFAGPLFSSLQKKIDRINLVFREGLTGVRVVRAFRQDNFEQNRFEDANKSYTDTAIKAFSLVSLMFPIMTLILNGTNIGIIWIGANLVSDRLMEIGNLVSFMTYAAMILFSFMMLSMVFVFIPRAQAAAVRIQEVLDTEYSIKEDSNPTSLNNSELSLEFKNVAFRYAHAERRALESINFNLHSGETLAIIGGTGAGKSTLVNLIPRLYDVESGQINLNGTDISTLSQSKLHEQIAFVQQKAFLFKGTIRSNLQVGKPNATEDEMWHALELAQAAEFIKDLDNGLDSIVEHNGANFSGGQRQRLAIARAIIKPADVYIFDDSFSALDFKTDAKLRKALSNDKKISQSIVIIVAQRIATVTTANQIIVLDEGQNVGKGTHAELKKTNSTYQEIIKSQLKGEDI
ncbi:ABC transporter ATP-binding protein [Liquorilactobacillus mali]|uniref:Multidrug ABC transporter permease ATP-binding protein n=1 Tax=Liquorilactobacillus mali KCTC 3596 = DSM 20444 TaxID=1046596 RepID=A0A0R2EEH9_9LACO|nr:ABC transporter ATP-binding protein [Liquorilactobacillus mali]KRN10605.1 multidrug ABC transporter permease ATP-binding protein [Liquorilactobacillus mali KCTC 3596 = DSM 20444]MDC7952901.1 ABC transporter ATP-binding protein [Liquorilactobacillus mali]MDV7758273.1 ATP-binding cassette domain-containing protein [Liquorilactobacillus mali]QFQ75365.1 ABC transporter ATP-binding protein [Liquorilactobacillus mali]